MNYSSIILSQMDQFITNSGQYEKTYVLHKNDLEGIDMCVLAVLCIQHRYGFKVLKDKKGEINTREVSEFIHCGKKVRFVVMRNKNRSDFTHQNAVPDELVY